MYSLCHICTIYTCINSLVESQFRWRWSCKPVRAPQPKRKRIKAHSCIRTRAKPHTHIESVFRSLAHTQHQTHFIQIGLDAFVLGFSSCWKIMYCKVCEFYQAVIRLFSFSLFILSHLFIRHNDENSTQTYRTLLPTDRLIRDRIERDWNWFYGLK